jgi:hypothetical protein
MQAIAMLVRSLLIFALALAGCGRPAPVNRTARQPSAPVVPTDPNIDRYVGHWAGDDGVELSITRNADGSATISLPPNAAWDAVVNNVRFDGSTLRYDLYMYYRGKEDFATFTNTVGDHPYSGVRNEVTLTKGDVANTLIQRLVTKDVPQGIESVLRRHGGGG